MMSRQANKRTRISRMGFIAAMLALSAAGALGQGQRGGAGSPQQASASVPGGNLPSGDTKRGEAYYLKYGCWECHGYTGQTGTAARLVTTVLNANGFVNYLRNPRTNQMPVYSAKVLSDQEAADLYAYIKTFKRPPEVKEIPLLQQIINEK